MSEEENISKYLKFDNRNVCAKYAKTNAIRTPDRSNISGSGRPGYKSVMRKIRPPRNNTAIARYIFGRVLLNVTIIISPMITAIIQKVIHED